MANSRENIIEDQSKDQSKDKSKDQSKDKSLLRSLPDDLLLPHANVRQASSITSAVSKVDAIKIMGILSKTSKSWHNLFEPNLAKLKSATLAELAQYIQDANQKKVVEIVKSLPNLLFADSDVVDKNTKEIINNFTPMQLAYWEGDTEMCSILEYYAEFSRHVDTSTEEIRKQLQEKFGEENRDILLTDKHLAEMLSPVFQAITNEEFNNGRDSDKRLILSAKNLEVIEAFRKEFAAIQPMIMSSGRRFPLEILYKVYVAYKDQAQLWSYNEAKCALFEDAVLSCVLRYISKNDAQRFAQGIHNLQSGHEFKRADTTCDKRDFNLVLHGPSKNFSLSGSCPDITFGMAEPTSASFYMLGATIICLEKLISSKNSQLEKLIQSPSMISRCTIS